MPEHQTCTEDDSEWHPYSQSIHQLNMWKLHFFAFTLSCLLLKKKKKKEVHSCVLPSPNQLREWRLIGMKRLPLRCRYCLANQFLIVSLWVKEWQTLICDKRGIDKQNRQLCKQTIPRTQTTSVISSKHFSVPFPLFNRLRDFKLQPGGTPH